MRSRFFVAGFSLLLALFWSPLLAAAQTLDFRVGANGGDGTSGTGPGEFVNPIGITVATDGDIYVADVSNHRIQVFDSTGSFLAQVGSGNQGNTQGVVTDFNSPRGVAVDDDGNLYVADQGNHQIVRCDSSGVCGLFAGNGAPGTLDGQGTNALFNRPSDLVLDGSGNLLIADNGNNLIRRCDSTATCVTVAGAPQFCASGDFSCFMDGAGTGARFNSPLGLGISPTGIVYVADAGNHAIRTVDPGTGFVSTALGDGSPGNTQGDGFAAQFSGPGDVAVDELGGVYVADTGNRRIAIYLSDHTFRTEIAADPSGSELRSRGVAVDSKRIYVTELDLHRLSVFLQNLPPAQPQIAVSPLLLDLGEVIVGNQGAATVTVSNAGGVDLVIGSVGVADGLAAPFALGPDTCSLQTVAPLGSCTVQIQFLPEGTGVFGDTFDVPSNDPENPTVEVQVSGEGVAPTVGGVAVGVIIEAVDCRNHTTGQKVKIRIDGARQSWDCETAGLLVNSGDKIDMTIDGVAE